MDDITIVLDFETTGLSPAHGARITEVAAVVIKGRQIVGQYQSLVNAQVPIPEYIQELTGITNAMIKKAPPASVVMRELTHFVGKAPLVAHNASFDRKFLAAELSRIRRQCDQLIACSMRVARRVYPAAPSYGLETLARYTEVPACGRHHRALADATMVAHLWLKMQQALCAQYQLRHVSFDLMHRLQAIPCRSLDTFIGRYRDQYGI